MSEETSPLELIERVRAGDQQAAAELFRRYEPALRRRVRVWLRMQDARLRRVFDSMDICQSVLASFFVRTAAGQFDLESPEQLLGLLFRIARHKLVNEVARQQAQRRDIRRDEAVASESDKLAQTLNDPQRLLMGQDLLDQVRRRLSADEQDLADRRATGTPWDEIAAELGGTPEARRKQLARALDRVTEELGLD
jgi:RNA polymerase sigma factor (sigma-70 family)